MIHEENCQCATYTSCSADENVRSLTIKLQRVRLARYDGDHVIGISLEHNLAHMLSLLHQSEGLLNFRVFVDSDWLN